MLGRCRTLSKLTQLFAPARCALGQDSVASPSAERSLWASGGSLASCPSGWDQRVRWLHNTPCSSAEADAAKPAEECITVTFVDKDGHDVTVKAPIGKNLLEVAHDNEIDLEGACEGSLACSTCHVIVEDEKYYKKMPEPSEDELDMLDLAFGLTDTSRLGCQVVASKDIDNIRVRLPAATRNFYVDGHKPKPH